MLEIGVLKHISYQLCRIEVGGKEKVQTQHVVQIYPVSLCHHIAEETQYVDYQQIFSYRRHIIHITSNFM